MNVAPIATARHREHLSSPRSSEELGRKGSTVLVILLIPLIVAVLYMMFWLPFLLIVESDGSPGAMAIGVVWLLVSIGLLVAMAS